MTRKKVPPISVRPRAETYSHLWPDSDDRTRRERRGSRRRSCGLCADCWGRPPTAPKCRSGAGDGRVGLYAGFCPGRLAALPRAAIHLGLPLPAGSSGLPADSGGQPSNVCAGRRLTAAVLLDLAPGGVYRATPVTRGAGGLLHHRFTLTSAEAAGGLFSVALSRGSPRVAVNHHPALWSPDVPRRRGLPRRRDRPADSSVVPPV